MYSAVNDNSTCKSLNRIPTSCARSSIQFFSRSQPNLESGALYPCLLHEDHFGIRRNQLSPTSHVCQRHQIPCQLACPYDVRGKPGEAPADYSRANGALAGPTVEILLCLHSAAKVKSYTQYAFVPFKPNLLERQVSRDNVQHALIFAAHNGIP